MQARRGNPKCYMLRCDLLLSKLLLLSNIEDWGSASKLIESYTGLKAGTSVAWETAGPGSYAVFTDGHVVYGFVPPSNPNIGAYLFDSQTGNVIDAAAAEYRGAIAVPFTKGK
jgi:hypothetical protein